MATEEPSNQQTEMLPPKKPKDDPTPAIRDILEIVDNLHKKFVPPSQKEQVLTASKSMGANNSSQVSENVHLRTTTSLPVPSSTEQDDTERYIPKLRRNLRLLKEDVVKLQDLRCEVADEVGKHITPLEKLLKKVEKGSSTAVLTKGMKKDLEDINKKIFNLMCQVPLLPNKRRKPGGLDSEGGDGENNGKGIECLPGIHANEEDLKRLAVFRDVRDRFKNLSVERRICLLSFAVFPENQEVNRTMLMYWWIGEGILICEERPEDVVKEILDEFVKEKLIEPVENKRKVEPNSYKMTPFVHSSVVLISKEIKLFDIYHKGKKPTMHKSDLNKVCLVEGSSSQPEAKATKMPGVNLIETVFNVSERFPDFAFKWFSEDQPAAKKKFGPMSKTVFKSLKVFYLGRWERTAKRHIEVENPELMRHLKHMTKLRLLSFQGISRIERLDDAVCKLRELIILDLRACYNLEKLPEKIDSLKALTYLDITDCYMIDRMPKRLSWLNNLVVLKGFVVSDANDEEKVCTLAELVHLEKLRKLSITINKGDFSVSDLFRAVEEFKSLEKFKVAWGGINEHKKVESTGGVVRGLIRTLTMVSKAPASLEGKLPKLPETLRKLDLQCFPDRELPTWLQPHRLGGLEKLYIKGGTELTGFRKFEPEETKECKVEVLRLKFLPRFKVEWRELRELFPKLEFLDKYQSPQVSFCPCDGIGIWRAKIV
ncbi:RNI-like superfamily protein [Raphanus sativus]|uniref:Disease resistance RPP13-like protein 4 n=1 Tax=Raphanus sativus TaxID=3726 RepID=A0A6J0NHT0_RAPSA|nr:disease resistance RPP13-like protein 4 [Raphanus sativus]KAJ4901573.1 RNI-like superfamily protein [Raphanus sativus]